MGTLVGVTSKPEITSFTLTENDRFMVLASDGLWEFLSNDYVIRLVQQYWELGKAEDACDHLIAEAVQKW
jgi:serine/threonine protein phosphatase PrpC